MQPALVHPTFPHHCPLETLLLTLPPFPYEERGARQPKPVTQGHSKVGLSSKPSSALDLSSPLYTRSEWVPLQEPLFRKATPPAGFCIHGAGCGAAFPAIGIRQPELLWASVLLHGSAKEPQGRSEVADWAVENFVNGAPGSRTTECLQSPLVVFSTTHQG